MKALVYTAGSGVALADVPPPAAGVEVLVNVLRAGVCGTDVGAVQRGIPALRSPVVVGHEMVGAEVGSGDLVTVNPLLSCGACPACSRGDDHLCGSRSVLGVHRDGAFAEQVAVPRENLVRLPADADIGTAALAEPLATSLHAWRRAAPRRGATVGIIGAGAIGLCTLALASMHQTGQVDICDVDELKLHHARRVDNGAVSTARSLPGTYDVVFDTVGSTRTREDAVTSLRPGGCAVLIGLHEDPLALPGSLVVGRELSLYGSFGYRRQDFRDAVARTDVVDPAWTTVLPLHRGAELLNGTSRPPQGTAKVLLTLDG